MSGENVPPVAGIFERVSTLAEYQKFTAQMRVVKPGTGGHVRNEMVKNDGLFGDFSGRKKDGCH